MPSFLSFDLNVYANQCVGQTREAALAEVGCPPAAVRGRETVERCGLYARLATAQGRGDTEDPCGGLQGRTGGCLRLPLQLSQQGRATVHRRLQVAYDMIDALYDTCLIGRWYDADVIMSFKPMHVVIAPQRLRCSIIPKRNRVFRSGLVFSSSSSALSATGGTAGLAELARAIHSFSPL